MNATTVTGGELAVPSNKTPAPSSAFHIDSSSESGGPGSPPTTSGTAGKKTKRTATAETRTAATMSTTFAYDLRSFSHLRLQGCVSFPPTASATGTTAATIRRIGLARQPDHLAPQRRPRLSGLAAMVGSAGTLLRDPVWACVREPPRLEQPTFVPVGPQRLANRLVRHPSTTASTMRDHSLTHNAALRERDNRADCCPVPIQQLNLDCHPAGGGLRTCGCESSVPPLPPPRPRLIKVVVTRLHPKHARLSTHPVPRVSLSTSSINSAIRASFLSISALRNTT